MPDNPPPLDLEYNTLRSEILKRIDLRQQMASIALTVAGIFLGVGVTNGTIALIYPPLAIFLAVSWAQNDLRIKDVATYLRKNLEPQLGLNYERWVQDRRDAPDGKHVRLTILAHGGIFIFTQLMALGVGLLGLLTTHVFGPLQIALLAVDGLSIILVFFVLLNARR